MGISHTSSAGAELAPSTDDDYQGEVGRTRTEPVHVTLPDGRVRTIAVYVSVDVVADPSLREPALTGALHRFEGGEELAVPFVYHDPSVHKFVLVVPPVLRHRALVERAAVMTALAGDTAHSVPDYVREASVVIGVEELASYLARPRDSDLAARSAAVESRLGEAEAREMSAAAMTDQIAQREQRLRERAEGVTRREDELARIAEEHEAGARDLAMRENELEERLASLVQREQTLADREAALTLRESAIEAHPPARRSAPPPAPTGRAASVRAPRPVAGLVDEELVEDVEELEELEPIGTTPRGLAAEVVMVSDESDAMMVDPSDVAALDPEPTRDDLSGLAEHVVALDGASVEELEDERDELAGVEEIEDVDELEQVDELDPAEDLEPVDDLEASDTPGLGAVRAMDSSADELEAGPPTTIAQARHVTGAPPVDTATNPSHSAPAELEGEIELIARVDDGVELFARLEDPATFAGELDLLVQLCMVDAIPVVLLSLVDPEGERPRGRRAALDPRASRDRLVLETLRRRFEARVVFFDGERNFVRTARVACPRELNTARILDRVSRLRAPEGSDLPGAMERALSAPPPLRAEHPFGERVDRAPASASEALVALEEMAAWSTPDRMDHALTVLSVPRDGVDAAMARVVEHAVEHGLALPAALASHALRAGATSEPAVLVATQIEAFKVVLSAADHGGLDDAAIAANWEKLLAAAAENEVALDTNTHDLAWAAIRSVRGDGAGEGDVDPAKLADMGTPELVLLLEHPRHRRVAAVALCSRGDASVADAVCRAARKMPRAEVVRVVPRVTKLGEEAGDALIDGLSARKTFVRQAFALALGELQLRRAVVPLLHVLLAEPSEVWREIARVLGHFGTASVRSLTQKLSDPKASEERLAWTLAHLANHGCQKQIDNLLKGKDRRVVAIAERALAERDAAKRHDEKIAGRLSIDEGEGAVAFSKRFIEEIEDRAPDVDLADEPG